MPTLAQIQAAFAALPEAKPSCYLVNQDDYDALEAATSQTFTAEELERGRAVSLCPPIDSIRLVPSPHVPRGTLKPMDGGE